MCKILDIVTYLEKYIYITKNKKYMNICKNIENILLKYKKNWHHYFTRSKKYKGFNKEDIKIKR